jgi:hypothetical protein
MSTNSDLALRNFTSREAVLDRRRIIARIGRVRRLEVRSLNELVNVSSRRESGAILIRRFRLENLDRDQNGIRPSNRWRTNYYVKLLAVCIFLEPFIRITT